MLAATAKNAVEVVMVEMESESTVFQMVFMGKLKDLEPKVVPYILSSEHLAKRNDHGDDLHRRGRGKLI